MIRIGDDYVVMRGRIGSLAPENVGSRNEAAAATEKVKTLVDAAVRWRRSGKHDDEALFAAVAPFMAIDTD